MSDVYRGGEGRGRGGRDRDRDRDRDRGDRDRDGEDRDGRGGRSRAKRKVDPFLADKTLTIDWRDTGMLARFTTERGKIVPRRVSGVTAKNQRRLAKAIKRARHAGLLPYGGHRIPVKAL